MADKKKGIKMETPQIHSFKNELENSTFDTLYRADKIVKFVTIKTADGDLKNFIPKEHLTIINAPSGSGKSKLLVELGAYCILEKHFKKVIYFDFDGNYTSLKNREQLAFLEQNCEKSFKLIIDEKIDEIAESRAKELEQILKSCKDENLKKELSLLRNIFQNADYNSVFELLAQNKDRYDIFKNGDDTTLDDTLIIIDTIQNLDDELEKRATSNKITRTLKKLIRAKNCTIVCANHTNKHKDVDGNFVFSGSQRLQDNSEYFVMLTPNPLDDSIVNIKELKNRHDRTKEFGIRIDFSKPCGERLELVNFVSSKGANTETQAQAISIIKTLLNTGEKARIEIKKELNKYNIGETVMEKVLKRLCDTDEISKFSRNKSTFYENTTILF